MEIIDSILAALVTAAVTSKPFLLYALYAVSSAFVLWVLWVTLNVAYNRKERLFYKDLLIRLLPIGALVDVLFNFTVAPVIFLELPHEATLSMRLTRYLARRTPDKTGYRDYGYRTPLAVWMATYLIEPWSPGHIGLVRFGYPPAKDLMGPFLKRWT